MNNQPRVQKKNKSTKLNGFTLFAKEFDGCKVKSGDENVFVSVREINQAKVPWERLSQSKKEVYKERAKELNMKTSTSTSAARYNSVGENFNDIEAKKQKSMEVTTTRRNEIQRVVRDASDLGVLDNKVFIFVATLDFYSDHSSIYPAEIAFSKFSLREGLIDSMSIRIYPQKLPIGSLSTALERSHFHKYPLPGSRGCDGESDYIEILLKIVDFLKPENAIPIFFTEGNPDVPNQIRAIENTTKTLKLIFDRAGEYLISSELKVYPIDELFFYLQNEIGEVKRVQGEDIDGQTFSSIAYAHERFQAADNNFAHISSLSCDYHCEKEAEKYCCLSVVKRYGFIIAQYCSQKEIYAIKEGRHYPKRS